MIADDPMIDEISAGLSENARKELLSLLGELFNIIDNRDAFCASPPPTCEDYMKFDRLRKLLAALGGQESKNERVIPSAPFVDSSLRHGETLHCRRPPSGGAHDHTQAGNP